MPYKVKGKCIYKKDSGAKVGCTKGSVDKYLAALHANANESVEEIELVNENTKKLIKRLIRENLEWGDVTPEYLINRIPFLKDYELFTYEPSRSQPIHFNLTRNVGFENVELGFGDNLVTMPAISIVSKFSYYQHRSSTGFGHIFVLDNNMYVRTPEDMSSVEAMAFRLIYKHTGENYSYSEEIYLNENEELTKEELDRVINEINRKFFAFEEFTDKNNIPLF